MTGFASAYPEVSITRGGDAFTVTRLSLAEPSAGVAPLVIAANPKRSYVLIRNTHATQTLYVGPTSAVDSTTGFEVLTNKGEVLRLDTTSAIYGDASGAATTVEVIEVTQG
jgi:hypothetical protein